MINLYLEWKNIKPGEKYPNLVKFFIKHGKKHITKESLEFYKNTETPGIICALFVGNTLIGVSASCWPNPMLGLKNSTFANVTVVHSDFVNQGIGRLLLSEKIAMCKEFTTTVAADNVSSRKMCEAAGLKEIRREMHTRKSGEYEAIIYGK